MVGAQKYSKKRVDATWRKVEYTVGQKVLLNVMNFTLPKDLTRKFISKFVALFPIMELEFKVVYKMKLPPKIKVHQTFHILLIKPIKENTLWPNCN